MERSLENIWQTLLPLFNDKSYLMAFGILASLLLAGQIFNLLRCRSSSATNTDHKVRVIISSWWKILLFVFFAFWGGVYSLVPIFFLLTIFSLREYISVSALNDNPTPLLIGGSIGAVIHYSSFLMHETFLFFASIHIYILLVVMPFLVFTPRPQRLAELVAFYLGVMVLVVFLSFPLAVMIFQSSWIGSASAARLAVLLLIVLTEVNDISQFTCGKLFGRNKIVAWISPNKTEAGFIGGALISTALGAFLWPRFLPINIGTAALLGFLLSLGGMLGDLVCSALKRYRGVKDFSDAIAGHGGMIDRIDSLPVTAPIFFFFLYAQMRMNG